MAILRRPEQTRETRVGAVHGVVVSKGKALAVSSLIRKVISTAKAPAAIGPYSQAVLVDGTIYISGQLAMDPASGQLVPGGVAEETEQALTNMGEILKAAGCDFTNVARTAVLPADINDFNTVNDIYKQYFQSSLPARAAQVAALPRGGQSVETEAVAVQGPLMTASL
ncbi:2-iminobutanoate/2-iminopropanoate deaminase-like [Orcinus orca]|uniref:2-iminobutanoate/2-iminopropanoate deaminase-like n=1 Tax=Orcinus orca TaxID=9733 RepID=UPI00144244B5|nr:2-iminobutanoate/2-iminopropanoate deaminase-like [Orcinus orca]